MMPLYDLTGEKFGRLTAVKVDRERMIRQKEEKGFTKTYWICECECGAIKSIHYQALTEGYTKSCGCLRKSRRKGDK